MFNKVTVDKATAKKTKSTGTKVVKNNLSNNKKSDKASEEETSTGTEVTTIFIFMMIS
jgi:two-component sensor histidine kinase